jgi:hypothetical protein
LAACAVIGVITVASAQNRRQVEPEPLEATADELLDEDQINRLRQAELQPRDAQSQRPPRIRFADRVIQRFVETQPDLDFRRFNQADDVTKALYILGNTDDAEIIDDVRVMTDPTSLLAFRQTIHTAVLEGCATSACHGGPNAGRFVLYPQPRNDAAVDYTNFYTLTRTTAYHDDPAGAAFGGGTVLRRMIDRDLTDSSLLLQYMLPPDTVDFGHPEVEGFRPVVNSPRNNLFQGIRNWIDNVLEKPAPTYDLDFDPPGQPDAPRPAPADEAGDAADQTEPQPSAR